MDMQISEDKPVNPRQKTVGPSAAERLFFDDSELGQYCRDWYQQVTSNHIRMGLKVGVFFNAAIILTIFFMDSRHPEFLGLVHAGFEVLLIAALFVGEAHYTLRRLAVLVPGACLIFAYAYVLRMNLIAGENLRYIIASSSLFLTLAGGMPFFVPLFYKRTIAWALCTNGLAWLILKDYMPSTSYYFILFFVLAVSTCAKIVYDVQILNHAAAEFWLRQTLVLTERQKAERDLDLAREVQAAMLPVNGMGFGDTSVHFHQVLHQKVGGDWFGVRKTPRGLALVVADASGKGVQAALIVQAVQTLWAEEPDGALFDPEAWIATVNRVLITLSQLKPQTLTLGILTIDDRCLTYWSAGHIPAYVKLSAHGVADRIHPMLARGDMLGIKPTVSLRPAILEVLPGTLASIVIGSDGAFSANVRYHEEDLGKLFVAVEKDGEAFVRGLDVEDDRTLVHVKVAA